MSLYVVADLSCLGAAADAYASAAGGSGRSRSLPSFGHAGADAAMAGFHRAGDRHAASLAEASRQAAQALHGYAVTFRAAGA